MGFSMPIFRLVLCATLFSVSLVGAATAQTNMVRDPFSELVDSFNVRGGFAEKGDQINQHRPTVLRASHRVLVRAHYTQGATAKSMRAQAEITIIDRDHVMIRLTRRGIGKLKEPR
jgi:hypothetical protein